MHVLRSIRLQLKSGFLRRAPAAFTLLRQYPPLNRDTALPVRRVETRNIPYLDLYEKATTKNPLYADEKVYPAYWAHEPQALTLAKKQYEYMQKGQTEEEAYQNAVKYVNTLENESYLELNKIVKSLDFDEPEGVRLPFMANPDLAAKVKEYRAKVNEEVAWTSLARWTMHRRTTIFRRRFWAGMRSNVSVACVIPFLSNHSIFCATGYLHQKASPRWKR